MELKIDIAYKQHHCAKPWLSTCLQQPAACVWLRVPRVSWSQLSNNFTTSIQSSVGAHQGFVLKMNSILAVMWLLCLLVFLPAVLSQFEDCAMLQGSDLGDITIPTTAGLLALALSGGDQLPSVQLQEFNIVCLAQGTVRDRYRSLSLIASYTRSTTPRTTETTQLHLQCVAGAWSTSNFGDIDAAASTPTGGTLTTTLRNDCLLCVDQSLNGQATMDEHCVCECL